MSGILVTGGAGYIGSHVVMELLHRGHWPIVLDNLQTGHRKAVQDVAFVQADLGDSDRVREVFRSFQIESVMHFAGDCLVGESVSKPLKYFNNNIKYALQLIEIMCEFNVNKIIFSSSASVYGEPNKIPIAEEHPCVPTNPYGETKLIFERILEGFHRSEGLDYISLRYFNAAGADPCGELGEDHSPETHLIPLGVAAALNGTPVPVYGTDYETTDGTCVRDYIHVTDLAQAHILALEKLEKGGHPDIYNLGNGSGYSVREVIEAIKRVTGRKISTVESKRRAGDPARLVASSEKIRIALGWEPQYSDLEAIIETAWEWHRNHPKGYQD
jgi:UDP-glucose 4-epimerase